MSQARLASGLADVAPGPGAYDTCEVDKCGRSATTSRHGNMAPSPWALSTTARLPEATPEEQRRGAPGEYNPSVPTVSERASAHASPSVHSQRGYNWHSDSLEQRLARLPFHQGVRDGSGATPGPGAYNPEDTDPRCGLSGNSNGRGLATTSFRSKGPQHGPPEPVNAPPPGTYETEPGCFQSAKSGDFSRLLMDKSDRFPPNVSNTGPSVGPGSYSPDVGEKKAKERKGAGKQGAQSYPFSSTDRRLGSGRRKLGNENHVYEADLVFAGMQALEAQARAQLQE